MLAVSCSAVTLLASLSFPASAPESSQPYKQCLLRWQLRGSPTCFTPLASRSAGSSQNPILVADSSGGLQLIAFGGSDSPSVRWFQVASDGGAVVSCIPSTATYLPLPAANQSGEASQSDDLAGTLFLGSRASSSQLRAVPAAVLQSMAAAAASGPAELSDAAGSSGDSSGGGGAFGNIELPVMEGQYIRSLAPVQNATPFTDPNCPSESQLLIASGVAPGGRLCKAKMGAALVPYLSEGPELPGDVSLFSFKARHAAEHDSYLAFSFVAANRTDIMDVSTSDVRPVVLGGLEGGSASLLVACLPGDWLLQVRAGHSGWFLFGALWRVRHVLSGQRLQQSAY